MSKKIGVSAFLVLVILSNSFSRISSVDAATEPLKSEVDDLNGAVRQKKQRVKELEGLISQYRSRIQDQETRQVTLENEIALFDTRIREKELAIERARIEVEALGMEIAALDDQMKIREEHLNRQKELIGEFVRRLHQSDEVETVDVLLTRPSLSSFFDRIEEVKRVEGDMGSSVDRLKQEKQQLEQEKKQQDELRASVLIEQKQMKKERLALEGERNFKTSLVNETQQHQEEFERVLYELRQQQQSTNEDVSSLEDRLQETLDRVDAALARGDVLLNWPVEAQRGVSAHFHDPSYPFRHLFEHPGTDIPTSVGTPVKAAAGGYVAWRKTGKMYGNYMMIIHPGGIATVYAHLSKFIAKTDTYVDRGEVIALSGGRPGDEGAGLSTGAHLHFEVRENGIPVDAENFLPQVAFEEEE